MEKIGEGIVLKDAIKKCCLQIAIMTSFTVLQLNSTSKALGKLQFCTLRGVLSATHTHTYTHYVYDCTSVNFLKIGRSFFLIHSKMLYKTAVS